VFDGGHSGPTRTPSSPRTFSSIGGLGRFSAGLFVGLLLASIGSWNSESTPTKPNRPLHVLVQNAKNETLQKVKLAEDKLLTMTQKATSLEEQLAQAKEKCPATTGIAMYSKEQLRTLHSEYVEKEVHFNNWYLGCTDLQFLSSHLRGIAVRLVLDQEPTRKLIFDVGANNGDDLISILGSFRTVQGMCKNFGSALTLISVEPSPKVFCELTEAAQKHPPQNQEGREKIHLLNVALSDAMGNGVFTDPGNEGGGLMDMADSASLGPMTPEEFTKVSQCQLDMDSIQNMPIDWERKTTVPTYTLDALMGSLENLNKLGGTNHIYILKIDTEGHDYKVLLGAKQLLEQKRVEFVIFETWNNGIVRSVVEYMSPLGYECYLISPKMLVPWHVEHHWYHKMDNFTGGWWGNGLCGIGGSKSMKMMWRSYHSDDLQMVNSYDLLYNTAN
jgi:FkbM family methyltransferase